MEQNSHFSFINEVIWVKLRLYLTPFTVPRSTGLTLLNQRKSVLPAAAPQHLGNTHR